MYNLGLLIAALCMYICVSIFFIWLLCMICYAIFEIKEKFKRRKK